MQKYWILSLGVAWLASGCCSHQPWRSANEALVIVHVPRASTAVVRSFNDTEFVGRISQSFKNSSADFVEKDNHTPIYEVVLCLSNGVSYRFTSIDGKNWKNGDTQLGSKEIFGEIWRAFIQQGVDAAHNVFGAEPINKEAYWATMVELQRLIYSDPVLAASWDSGELKKGFWHIDELSDHLQRW